MAATSSPTPAARAASSTASRAITCSAWRSCWRTARCCGWAAARTRTRPGFELHRLFVGSEGLLGVVTEATLETAAAAALSRLPRHRVWLDARRRALAARHPRRRFPARRAGTGRFLHPRRRLQTHRERAPARLPGPPDRRARRPGTLRARRNQASSRSIIAPAEAALRRSRPRRRTNARRSGRSAANSPTPCATPA